MDAVYLVSRKDYKQSLNVFKSVNTENMNPREKNTILLSIHFIM